MSSATGGFGAGGFTFGSSRWAGGRMRMQATVLPCIVVVVG